MQQESEFANCRLHRKKFSDEMKEIREILQKISELEPNEKVFLVTVVDVKGSSYRLPGARMLISSNDEFFGMISGGCLEADLLERIKQSRSLEKPFVFLYDTTQDESSIFSLNMGCKGIVKVLVEPIYQSSESLIVEALRKSIEKRETQVVATLVGSENNGQIGGRICYNRNEGFSFENLNEEIAQTEALKETIENFFNQKQPQKLETFRLNEAEYEFFIEKFTPPLKLLIFGAGYDALPVVKIAKQLGWTVSVIDHRPAFASKERFPEADEISVVRAENLDAKIFQDENLAVVIMTHNYEQDRIILEKALQSDCFYIGMLGPKRRAEQLLSEMASSAKVKKDKLYSPVGLDLGADTPETIALSIVAEIIAVSKGRSGTNLRNRTGSIYGRY
ncbi:MAG: XdhC/CoxI family protein [Acidobacteria bacterium]|nr:MAG: XdhC/CoxI family protein [Acidobacteriota bacterium]